MKVRKHLKSWTIKGNVLTQLVAILMCIEGTYVVTHNGNEVQVAFTPTADFQGQPMVLILRWKDSNGSSANWQSN